MKARKIALLAALPAAILSVNSAYAGAEVYGKINVSTQFNSTNTDDGTAAATNGDIVDNTTLESNASRFGVKASTDLGETGLKAVAKIEYEVFADDGVDGSSGDELKQRNIYGGIQGDFGTVIAGKFDTPMKESQGKVDLFNDLLLGDINNVLLVGETRADNIMMYSTPKMESGIAAHIAVMDGEDSGNETIAYQDENSDFADYVSASITYDSDLLYLALAHDTGSAPAGTTVNATSGAEITRLTGQVKLMDNQLALGAIYQVAESADNNAIDGVDSIVQFGAAGKGPFGSSPNWNTHITDQDGLILSAQYTLDKHVFKLQYGMSEGSAETPTLNGVSPNQFMTYTDNGDDLEIDLVSVGYDYMLDKKAKVYAYYSDYSAEQSTVANVNREVTADTLGVGFEYSF